MLQQQFLEITQLIKYSRTNAIKSVNAELINLYWNIGAYVSMQLNAATWGEKTVQQLADFIQANYPELKGFNRRGLYRMKQFYETYSSAEYVVPSVFQLQVSEIQKSDIVSSARSQLKRKEENVPSLGTQIEISDVRNSLLAQISWTHHRTIFSRCRTNEEKEFYLKLCVQENYSVRELERQISSGAFERIMIGNSSVSATIKKTHTSIAHTFKDSYVFEFLNLPEPHNEKDLQKALVRQMKDVILELGKDFIFIDEEYKIQVGNSDFFIDLLFYHRGLQCLVAFELKADKFKPEHLGKINFYLEALDRDVRRPNEKPSIGILLCKDKDSEVVEYALSRSLSPTLVSEYKTQLPDKRLLQQKLHEIFTSL